MYNNFYDERFRWEHMHYDRIITYGMNHIREYINNLADINENCSDVYNDLCAKNNIDKDKVKKSDKTLKFEAKLRDCYTIACNYYYELEKMKEDNLSGICVEPDVRNLFERFNNERLPIIENVSIKLCPITEQDTQQQETGFAANVSEIQFPANSVRSEDAPTIAGVERGKPMSFEDAGGNLANLRDKNMNIFEKIDNAKGSYVNQYFVLGGGYHRNCQICIAVFEARMRGYTIEALPFDENNEIMMKLRENPRLAFTKKNTKKPPREINTHAIDYNTMLTKLDKIIKPNERYGFIYVHETYKGSGELIDHIIIAYKNNQGNLEFYDPQNGIKYEKDLLRKIIVFGSYVDQNTKKIINHPPKIFRIDNVDLNNGYLNNISKKFKSWTKSE